MSRFGKLEFGSGQGDELSPSHRGPDEAKCLKEANDAFTQGNFEGALRLFARALEHNQTNPSAWTGQVRMLIELADFQQAKQWADRALELFPRDAELLAAKAVALARLGDLPAAMAFSDAAVEREPQEPYTWLARGDVLLAKDEKGADYCFSKALAAAPGQWLWPWLASRIHLYYRRMALALKLISQAMALDASQSVIWAQMGKCQLALGLASAAQTSLEQARQLNPQSLEAATALEHLHGLDWWERLRGKANRWLGR